MVDHQAIANRYNDALNNRNQMFFDRAERWTKMMPALADALSRWKQVLGDNADVSEDASESPRIHISLKFGGVIAVGPHITDSGSLHYELDSAGLIHVNRRCPIAGAQDTVTMEARVFDPLDPGVLEYVDQDVADALEWHATTVFATSPLHPPPIKPDFVMTFRTGPDGKLVQT
jgi:hypothetical protein